MIPNPDVIDKMLAWLRVSGSVLLTEDYTSPWGIEVPAADGLTRLIGAGASARAVAFHLVRRGGFELSLPGRKPVVVGAGEVVVVTGGAPHRMSEGQRPAFAPLASMVKGRAAAKRTRGPTSLVCGVFVLHDVALNPLFGALPPLLHTPVAGPAASYLARSVADLLAAEVAGAGSARPWVLARLLELLYVEAMLAAMDTLRPTGPNWLRAVSDPSIGSALAAFHRAPSEPWSVRTLARCATLSPSRFAARFRGLVGEGPMSYVTRWRLSEAMRQLRDGSDGVETIGSAAGYASTPSFSRAFKRHFGLAPSRARKRAWTAGEASARS